MHDGLDLGGWDVESMLNFRDWLKQAVEDKGARCVGSGGGLGGCDIVIELDGVQFSIRCSPIIID